MVLEAVGEHAAVNEAHAREVAAIEAMTTSYFEPVTRDRSIAQLISDRVHGYSPVQAWLDAMWSGHLPQLQQAMTEMVAYGTVLVKWDPTYFDEVALLPPAREPPHVMGRPRKIAPKPGRKFSGMSRFAWRQR